MLRSQAALCESTGSLEMLVFQMLLAGNIGQFGAPGTVVVRTAARDADDTAREADAAAADADAGAGDAARDADADAAVRGAAAAAGAAVAQPPAAKTASTMA